MNFYLLNTMPVEDDDYCFLVKPPTGIEMIDYKTAKGLPIAAEYPADVRMYMDDNHQGIKVPDLIGNSRGLLIVSKRLKEAIEQGNTGATEYLPMSIYNHKRRRASGDHFIVNPLGAMDCLDLARSDIEWLDGEVVAVNTFVLDPGKLKNVPDLFRIKEEPHRYVISEQLARQFMPLDPTNIYLEELTLAS
jgi:hypothetical protein